MQASSTIPSADVVPHHWTAVQRLELIERILTTPDSSQRSAILRELGVTDKELMQWVNVLEAIEKVAGRQCVPQPKNKRRLSEGELEQVERALILGSEEVTVSEIDRALPESIRSMCMSLSSETKSALTLLLSKIRSEINGRRVNEQFTVDARHLAVSLRHFATTHKLSVAKVFEVVGIEPAATYAWEKSLGKTSSNGHSEASHSTSQRIRAIDEATESDAFVRNGDTTEPAPASTITTLDVAPSSNGHHENGDASLLKKGGRPSWVRDSVNSRPISASRSVRERQEEAAVRHNVGLIIEGDETMDDVWRKTVLASRSNGQLLIRGESGTGKELIFKSVHELRSHERTLPRANINCAAIPEQLCESQLFGHKKGSFTDAREDKNGHFHTIQHGGTLFLDEIGDMSLPLQAKLLRVIQDRKFTPVGGTEEISLSKDAKIIASTHRNLESMMRSRRFREDLFHRLSGQQIFIPALRERSPQHKTALIGHFLAKIAIELNRQVYMNETAFQAMLEFEHTGNVRQLANHLNGAAGFAGLGTEGEILIEESHINTVFQHANAIGTPDIGWTRYFDSILKVGHDRNGSVHFSVNVRDMDAEGGTVDFARLIEAIDTAITAASVEQNGGVQSSAAKQLGLTRGTIRDRLTRIAEILKPDGVQDE